MCVKGMIIERKAIVFHYKAAKKQKNKERERVFLFLSLSTQLSQYPAYRFAKGPIRGNFGPMVSSLEVPALNHTGFGAGQLC